MEKMYKLHINSRFVEGAVDPLDAFNPAAGKRLTAVCGAAAD